MAQVRRLDLKVGGRLVQFWQLFCIYRVNRINPHNNAYSWWQHHAKLSRDTWPMQALLRNFLRNLVCRRKPCTVH